MSLYVRIRAGTTCRVELQVNSEADAMSFGFAYSKLALETITIKMAHQYEPQRIRFNGWWAFLFFCAAVLTEICLCGACSGHVTKTKGSNAHGSAGAWPHAHRRIPCDR